MRTGRVLTIVATTLCFASAASAASAVSARSFREVDLISDLDQRARFTDAHLVNPWGLVETASGQFRVANEGTASSTAYGPQGRSLGPIFDVGEEGAEEAGPTGVVANRDRHEFLIGEAKRARPARFIFSTHDGSLWAWNPDLDAEHAQRVSHDEEAVYTGLALASFRSHPYLYVANFSGGAVEVYDTQFHEVDLSGDFEDPDLPDGYAPFNVANVDGRLFVAYAKRAGEDEEPGPGLGIVSEFDAGGRFVRRFASHGTLNAPWGVALAPRGFGRFSKAIVVGNFGDGTINAFDRRSGRFLGHLEDAHGDPIMIEGLWGIAFSSDEHEKDHQDREDVSGNQGRSGDLDLEHDKDHSDRDDDGDSPRLYFAAGIGGETHGLFGYIVASRGGHHDDSDDRAVAAPLESPRSVVDGTRVALAGVQPVRIASGVRFAIALPTGAALDLAIFDAAGRLVARPARALTLTGSSELRWNATNSGGEQVSPGIYFWRADAARQTSSGRIVLLP